MENFTALRNGILEHRRAGKMPPFDSGIFDHMIMRADWETGIYHGCALALAFDFGDVSLKEQIQRCLRRLRDRRYINYPTGTGARGGYDILIHKYEVTKGKLSGMRLNAGMHNGLPVAEYEPQNGEHTVNMLSTHGGHRVGTPIQDLKTLQDVQECKSFARKGASEKRASRIPEDFAVTPKHRAFAIENGLPSPESEIEKFKDYFRAASGQGSVKKDWEAAFRNWLRRAAEISNRNGQGGKNGKPSIGEIVEREQAFLRSRSVAQ